MKKVYIGLDVHSKSTTYFSQDEKGKELAKGKVATTTEGFMKMQVLIQGNAGEEIEVQVGLESGNMARYTVLELRDLGWEPVVIDAGEVRAKARRINQKSDSRDAYEICDGIRRGIYTNLVHIPSDEVQKLREALSRRRHFIKLSTREINATKYLLRSQGFVSIRTDLSSEGGWKKMLDGIKEHVDERTYRYIQMHYEAWRTARQIVDRIGELMQELAQPFQEELRKLQTIPGVGSITALTAIAVLSDVSRFPSDKHAASYIGLVPQTYQSGENDRHGHITKRGSSDLRSLLVEAAHHASSLHNPLNPYFAKLSSKRGYKMAVVAVAHRLLRIIVAMLKHRRDFDVEKLNVEQKVQKKTKTRYYRIKQKKSRAA